MPSPRVGSGGSAGRPTSSTSRSLTLRQSDDVAGVGRSTGSTATTPRGSSGRAHFRRSATSRTTSPAGGGTATAGSGQATYERLSSHHNYHNFTTRYSYTSTLLKAPSRTGGFRDCPPFFLSTPDSHRASTLSDVNPRAVAAVATTVYPEEEATCYTVTTIWVGDRTGAISVWLPSPNGSAPQLVCKGEPTTANTFPLCVVDVADCTIASSFGAGQVWVGYTDGAIVGFRATLGAVREVHRQRIHSSCVQAFATTSALVFSGSADCTIVVWEPSTMQAIQQLSGHSSHVQSLFVSGPVLYSGSSDCTVRTWNIDDAALGTMQSNDVLTSVMSCPDPVTAIAMSASSQLWVAHESGFINVWSTVERTSVVGRITEPHSGPIHAVGRIAQGALMYSTSYNVVLIWRAVDRTLVGQLKHHDASLSAVLPAVDNRAVVQLWTASIEGSLVAQNLELALPAGEPAHGSEAAIRLQALKDECIGLRRRVARYEKESGKQQVVPYGWQSALIADDDKAVHSSAAAAGGVDDEAVEGEEVTPERGRQPAADGQKGEDVIDDSEITRGVESVPLQQYSEVCEERAALQTTVADLETKVRSLEQVHKESDDEILNLKAELRVAEAAKKVAAASCNDCQKLQKKLEEERGRHAQVAANFEQQQEMLQRNVDTLEQELLAMTSKLVATRQELTQERSNHDAAKQAIDEVKAEVEELRGAVADRDEEAALTARLLQDRQEECDRLSAASMAASREPAEHMDERGGTTNSQQHQDGLDAVETCDREVQVATEALSGTSTAPTDTSQPTRIDSKEEEDCDSLSVGQNDRSDDAKIWKRRCEEAEALLSEAREQQKSTEQNEISDDADVFKRRCEETEALLNEAREQQKSAEHGLAGVEEERDALRNQLDELIRSLAQMERNEEKETMPDASPTTGVPVELEEASVMTDVTGQDIEKIVNERPSDLPTSDSDYRAQVADLTAVVERREDMIASMQRELEDLRVAPDSGRVEEEMERPRELAVDPQESAHNDEEGVVAVVGAHGTLETNDDDQRIAELESKLRRSVTVNDTLCNMCAVLHDEAEAASRDCIQVLENGDRMYVETAATTAVEKRFNDAGVALVADGDSGGNDGEVLQLQTLCDGQLRQIQSLQGELDALRAASAAVASRTDAASQVSLASDKGAETGEQALLDDEPHPAAGSNEDAGMSAVVVDEVSQEERAKGATIGASTEEDMVAMVVEEEEEEAEQVVVGASDSSASQQALVTELAEAVGKLELERERSVWLEERLAEGYAYTFDVWVVAMENRLRAVIELQREESQVMLSDSREALIAAIASNRSMQASSSADQQRVSELSTELDDARAEIESLHRIHRDELRHARERAELLDSELKETCREMSILSDAARLRDKLSAEVTSLRKALVDEKEKAETAALEHFRAQLSERLGLSGADFEETFSCLMFFQATRPKLCSHLYELFVLARDLVPKLRQLIKDTERKNMSLRELHGAIEFVMKEAMVCREGARWIIANLFTPFELQHLGAPVSHFRQDGGVASSSEVKGPNQQQ